MGCFSFFESLDDEHLNPKLDYGGRIPMFPIAPQILAASTYPLHALPESASFSAK
jgi:hypothetical protein